MIDPSSSEPGSATLPREILVIEDDPCHGDVVRETLEEEGYRVQLAVHGRDALARLAAGPLPDVILLDLLMPVMDGWAFMANLKARAELSTIPVVATTAAGLDVLFSAPVCAGYLTKPLQRSQLLETIARCLSRVPPHGGPVTTGG
jgi:CheY-like chemotaxis protein